MIKDFICLFLAIICFSLFFLLLSGTMCNCRCIPYKPGTTTYRAFLA